ncbi:hypothetical protein BEP19_02745 [Ammoniphilus oxalaticus]|uniref:Lipoprotein n=1 Tax=Ammoniphilus oxalaticus TaxID=66863 RepID=A0A419SNM5_9BACL|nr:hypothetical protein [Ammoniphilus oxalaticus]RKD25867.1 hypothetical protein BEP19_02745 [Ammoniphilus oxalaticus]
MKESLKGYILSAFMVLLFALTGCSEERETIKHDFTYTGEGELWSAVYEVNGTQVFYKEDGVLKHDSEKATKFQLIYKGSLEDLTSIKKLEYDYLSNIGSGRGWSKEFNPPPTDNIFTEIDKVKGGALESKDSIIRVTVKWDGNTEEFTLENNEVK